MLHSMQQTVIVGQAHPEIYIKHLRVTTRQKSCRCCGPNCALSYMQKDCKKVASGYIYFNIIDCACIMHI